MSDVQAAEKAIVGAVLLSNGRVLDDLRLEHDDFWSPALGGLFRLMQGMRRAGKATDMVTVAAEAAASSEPELRAVNPASLHECVDGCPSVGSAEFYADIVAEEAVRRRLKAAGQGVVAAADEGGDVVAAVDKARGLVDGAAKIRTSNVMSFGETIDRTIDALESKVPTFPTPWADLNRGIGGWAPARLYVVGARPGVGKSVFGLGAAMGLCGKGAVAFISLEMSNEEIQIRAISHDLKINLTALERRELDEGQWRKIAARRGTWEKVPLFVGDESSWTVASIRQFVRSVSRRAELAAVVVDYIQLISAPRGWQGKRQELVSDVSRELKIISREFNVPVLALSQLNRSSESREDKRPSIADLRESGAIEQDADVVILLHRDQTVPEKAHEMHMIVAKNRHGPTGNLTMDFLGHYSEIRDQRMARPAPVGGGNSYMDRTGQ